MFAHSLIMIITKISEIIHMEICVRYCTNEHRYSYQCIRKSSPLNYWQVFIEVGSWAVPSAFS